MLRMTIGSLQSYYTAPAPSPQSAALSGAKQAEVALVDDLQRLAAGDISVERVTGVMESSYLYSMNLQLLKLTDEMVGQVIDLLA